MLLKIAADTTRYLQHSSKIGLQKVPLFLPRIRHIGLFGSLLQFKQVLASPWTAGLHSHTLLTHDFTKFSASKLQNHFTIFSMHFKYYQSQNETMHCTASNILLHVMADDKGNLSDALQHKENQCTQTNPFSPI